LRYQNHAKGAQTYAWVASTGAPSALAVSPKKLLLLCGHNDVDAGRTSEQIQGDLDTIAALLSVGQQLLVCEILPANSHSDAEVAVARGINSDLATWCAANGARLVVCRQEMGQVRVSTGEYDDYLAAYNQGDDTHLSAAGVDKMAEIIRRYL
jgi:lysophospholipase L1-like esterase